MSETNSSIHNTKVFFDIIIGNESAGRIIISLFTSDAPHACEKFRALCTGENFWGGNCKPLRYKGSTFHRVIPGLICEGGVIDQGIDYCTEGESSSGHDTFAVNHSSPGMLSMANTSPASNDSSFFICMSDEAPCKNGKRCLGFGQVIEGHSVLRAIESMGSVHGKTEKAIIIKNCGQLLNNVEYGRLGAGSKVGVSPPSKVLESPTRSILHKRTREEYETGYVVNVEEHLKEVDNIKAELMKLLEKETELKGMLPGFQRQQSLLADDLLKILLDVQVKIAYLKKKISVFTAIPYLCNEGVLKVESVLKKYEG